MECVNLDLDIVCLSETWLLNDDEAILNSFYCASKFSRKNHIRGGAAIYVKTIHRDSVVQRTDIVSLGEEMHIEVSAIDFTCSDNTKITVLSIYRSNNPQADINTFFCKLEQILILADKSRSHVILTGDLNIDMNDTNPYSRRLDYLIDSFTLHYTTNEFTRITPASASKIDYIITDFEVDDYRAAVQPFSGLSDHEGIIFVLSALSPVKHNSQFTYRPMSNISISGFLESLDCEDWGGIYESPDPNVSFNAFINIFLLQYNNWFPVKTINKTVCNKNWVTREIKDMSQTLRDLYYLKVNNPSDAELSEHYKKYKQYYHKFVEQAKKAEISSKINGARNVQKTSWGIINQMTRNKRESRSLSTMKINNKTVSEPSEIANYINSFYLSLGQNRGPPDGRACEGMPRNDKSFFLHPVTEAGVFTVLMNLNNSSTTDIYDLTSIFLKKCARHIIAPLTHIFNSMFTTGIFPDKMKTAKVIPVYKKGNKEEVENYRPISILPVISKVAEKIMHDQLMKFLTSCTILANEQHGFLSGRSTSTAAFQLTREVLERLEGGEVVLGAFLDLSKAFDLVDHAILLEKLECYGIRGTPLNLLESYLGDRKQLVQIELEGRVVTSKLMACGPCSVPQGSILGPLLFNLYINDLPVAIKNPSSSLTLYADDVSLIASGKQPTLTKEVVTTSLDSVSKWLSTNSLKLNNKKTELMAFGNRGTEVRDVDVCGDTIRPTDKLKFLGLHLDPSLKWSVHTEFLSKKLSSVCSMLRKLSKVCPMNTLLTAYYGNFHSIMTYCVEIWGSGTGLTDVLKIQKRAIRIITNSKRLDHCREKFRNLRIMTCVSAYIYRCLIFIQKNLDLYTKNSDRHNYDTRHVLQLQPVKHLTTRFEKGLFYSALTIYNKLPLRFKSAIGTSGYKKQVKAYLLDNPYYTLAEYLNA